MVEISGPPLQDTEANTNGHNYIPDYANGGWRSH
jgi:hypothetical protein